MKFKNKGDKERYFRSVMDKLSDNAPNEATPELLSFMIFSLIETYQHDDDWPLISRVVTEMIDHHGQISGAIDDAVEFMGGIVQSRRLGDSA
tara:strand:+ start:2733 stop:3008 length:276 start_codon:yes stop_codon:yes gene_type:complete